MLMSIASIIYENQYGCSRNEAITCLGFSEETYPSWANYKNKIKFVHYDYRISKFLKYQKKLNKEKLAKFIYELLNPESNTLWSINPLGDSIYFTGEVFNDFCLAQHEQDDYRTIAHHIMIYLGAFNE